MLWLNASLQRRLNVISPRYCETSCIFVQKLSKKQSKRNSYSLL